MYKTLTKQHKLAFVVSWFPYVVCMGDSQLVRDVRKFIDDDLKIAKLKGVRKTFFTFAVVVVTLIVVSNERDQE